MIQIKEVEVRNWCQHEHRRIRLGAGTNAVIGPNGSGKSNLVGAIAMLFTGTPPLGRLEENIRDGEDEAVLWASFVANGQTGEITRTIRAPYADTPDGYRERGKTTTKVALELEGQKPICKLGDANKALTDLVGVPASVLNTHVFVGQTDLSKLLFETPAERKASVMSILPGVSRAETIYTAIYRELSANPPIELAVSVDEYAERLRDSEERLSTAVDKLEAAEKEEAAIEDDAEKAADLQKAHERGAEAHMRWQALLPTCASAEEEHQFSEAVLKDAKEKYDSVDPDYQMLRPQVGQMNERVGQLRAAKAQIERAVELAEQLETAKRRLSSLEAPLSVDPAIEQEQLNGKAWLADLEAEERQIRKILHILESGKPVCSECGRPIDNPEAERAKKTERLEQVGSEKAILKRRLSVVDQTIAANQLAHQTYRLERGRLEQQISLLAKQATDVRWTSEMAAELNKWTERLEIFEQVSSERETYGKALEVAQANNTRAEAKLSQLRSQVGELKVAAEQQLDDKALLNVRTVLDQQQAAVRRTYAAKAIKDAAEREVSQNRAHLEEARTLLKKQEALLAYRDLLERAREVFHRDNLPTETMRRFVLRLNQDCNDFLGYFGNPFSVEITKDLDVWVTKPDGYRHAAERLSGGQQCVMSLAFRFATNRIFAPGVGLITLDEPTEYLDVDNVGYLADVMRQLATLNRASGTQTIVITHAKELLSAFDHVVQLGSGE